MTAPHDVDMVVIGGGVVGLSVGAELARRRQAGAFGPATPSGGGEKGGVFVLERHPRVGQETSSRNSEVIHSGIYYPRDSLKARLCVEGAARLRELAATQGIPHRICGKVIVATEDSEREALDDLLQMGRDNGARDLSIWTSTELQREAPGVLGVAALFSPHTGIIDSWELMLHFKGELERHGGMVVPKTVVTALEPLDPPGTGFRVVTQSPAGDEERLTCGLVVNAAGLNADVVAALAGVGVEAQGYSLHHCKGSYFSLRRSAVRGIQRLVYPVPRHLSGGLGVHLTLDMSGNAKLGPDARYVDRTETPDYSVDEDLREPFLRAAQRYLPHLAMEDLGPDTAGLRPRLYGPGETPRDFIINEEVRLGLPGLINLVGIESPGLTASPAIARVAADLAASHFKTLAG